MATLSTISGITKLLKLSEAEVSKYASKIFPANILILEPNGKILLSDGMSPLSDLPTRIDQTLTQSEKNALNAAFVTGKYKIASGGVVVHDNKGKIDDASLKLVSDGKIVASYLSDYVDPATNKIKADAISSDAGAETQGAVMYDHPVDMSISLTDLINLSKV